MDATKQSIIDRLSPSIPKSLVESLLDEYVQLKHEFILHHWRPDELSGGRFSETYYRILEAMVSPSSSFTPLGKKMQRSAIAASVRNCTAMHESFRFFVLPALDIMLDVRNRRDVAHPGGDVNPNQSDARLVCQLADWTLAELIRVHFQCHVSEAQQLVDRITQVSVPVVVEIDGFLRVQNTKLNAMERTLIALYHKWPEKQQDTDLVKWVQYTNPSRYRSTVLAKMHQDAHIHYEAGSCTLLPKGRLYVEKNLSLELTL